MDEKFIRDVTKVGSIPKSEVRTRLKAIIDQALSQQRETIVKWAKGNKRIECGYITRDGANYQNGWNNLIDDLLEFLNKQDKIINK